MLVLLSALLFSGAARAGDSLPTPEDWLYASAEEADGVFVGVVVDIQYRESDPGRNGETFPHTFVTWRVERGLKGIKSGSTFTARFIGGPTDDGRRVLRVSEMPEFDLGDRDLLFVDGNGNLACPLVGGADGRLRLIDDRAYTDGGREIGLDTERRLVVGSFWDLAEARTTTIGDHVFGQSGDPSPDDERGVPLPSTADQVLDLVGEVVADFPAERPLESVDLRTPFVLELQP